MNNVSVRRIGDFVLCCIAMMERLRPAIDLGVRLWMASIFWKSGLVKIGNWEGTLSLFANDYKVPFLPVELAAYSATFFELACPVFLTLGLASRWAALPLLAMTAVIQMTYPNPQHYGWALLLGVIILHGPGAWSLDALIKRKYAATAG